VHLKKQERTGHYTGERLEANRSAVYQAITLMLIAGIARLEIARRCGVGHHTVEVVQFRDTDSIAIVKKGLARRMHGTVVSAVDAVWQYIEGLKQAKTTGYGGRKAEQKGIGDEVGQSVEFRGREWLGRLGVVMDLMAGKVGCWLPVPVGAPGANLGGSVDSKSTESNDG